MRDQTIHAKDPDDSTKTYCGAGTFGKKVTTKHELITCKTCLENWVLDNEIAPRKEKPHVKLKQTELLVETGKSPAPSKRTGKRRDRSAGKNSKNAHPGTN